MSSFSGESFSRLSSRPSTTSFSATTAPRASKTFAPPKTLMKKESSRKNYRKSRRVQRKTKRRKVKREGRKRTKLRNIRRHWHRFMMTNTCSTTLGKLRIRSFSQKFLLSIPATRILLK